ncbi:hypothetical protein C5167_027783 [Papaver somniferum]|nr:hypothetical protein C5167_027783 [Papaver somniferum]
MINGMVAHESIGKQVEGIIQAGWDSNVWKSKE